MSRRSQIILEVCEILSQQESLKVCATESIKGAAIVGIGTFIGALVGGRPGLLAGAALGSAAALAVGTEFKSVIEIIREDMTDSQRKQLVNAVGSLLRGIEITNAVTVAGAIAANSGLKSEVLNEVTGFLTNQMGMTVF